MGIPMLVMGTRRRRAYLDARATRLTLQPTLHGDPFRRRELKIRGGTGGPLRIVAVVPR